MLLVVLEVKLLGVELRVKLLGVTPFKAELETELRFQILRKYLPERDRLADLLFRETKARSADGPKIVQDLFSLCLQTITVLYRRGEEPQNGHCPFNECMKALAGYYFP